MKEMKREVNRMSAGLSILFFMLAFLFFGFAADAADSTTKTDTQEKTIRIGYIDYEGFFDPQEDGSLTGYGVDLLNEISKYTGWKYEYVYGTFDELMKKVKNGEVDFICHAQKTDDREKDYLFSEYQTGSEADIFYVRGDDTRYYYNDFESFNGMKIGLLAGSFQNQKFQDFAKQNDFSFKTYYYDEVNQAYAALDSGEIDGVAMGGLAGVDSYKVVCRFGSDPYYFITGKMNENLKKEVDSAMGQILAINPSFESELFQKYYGNASANTDLLLTKEEHNYIQNTRKNPLIVGVSGNSKPLSYEKNGEVKGIVPDLMNLMAKKAGLKLEYKFLEAGEKPQDFMDSGKGQIVAGVYTSQFSTVPKGYEISNPIMNSNLVVLGKKGKTIESTDKLRITLRPGYINDYDGLKTVFPNIKITEATSAQECLQNLENGDADIVLQNIYVARTTLQKPEYEDLELYQGYWFDESMCALGRESENQILSIINKLAVNVTEDEKSQIIMSNTSGGNELSFTEFLFKYRVPTVLITILILTILVAFFLFSYEKQRNLKRVEVMNKELKNSNTQLKQAVEMAERASAAKSDFLSRMSHDMRTPMNGILGVAHLMREKTDVEEMHEDTEHIIASGQLLLSLINDTLDMNKIESGKLELHLKPVLSTKPMDNVYHTAKLIANEANVKIDWQIPENHATKRMPIIADAPRVEQILLNILSNAIKYSEEGSTVTFCMSVLNKTADTVTYRYVISDHGIGISEDFLPHVFDKFSQEGRVNTERSLGTGLGMSIVKQILELMNGTISMESKLGEGTKVTIEITYPIYKKDIKEEKKFLSKDLEVLDGKRILLCEDHPLNQQIACKLLEKMGMEVSVAEDGEKGVLMYEASEPFYYDAILMDIRMPKKTGYEATADIRALPRDDAKQIPIIALTANAFQEDIEAGLEAGMNAHVAKPIVPNQMYQTLAELIRQGHNGDRRHQS